MTLSDAEKAYKTVKTIIGERMDYDNALRKAIGIVIEEARTAALEEAAKTVCYGCRKNIGFIRDRYHSDGYGQCDAWLIRALSRKAGG
jgi:hypothetical protein